MLSTFLAAIKTLFVDGRCTSCGYTGFMLGSLNTTRTCPLKSGTKAIGGAGAVTDRIVKRCLQRMPCWVKLDIASVRAEFPHWELLQAYQVFHIDAQHTRNTVLQLSDSFDRLGSACSVSSADLKTQYVDHLAIATQEVQAGSSCPHAWATAVRRTQTRATTRLN